MNVRDCFGLPTPSPMSHLLHTAMANTNFGTRGTKRCICAVPCWHEAHCPGPTWLPPTIDATGYSPLHRKNGPAAFVPSLTGGTHMHCRRKASGSMLSGTPLMDISTGAKRAPSAMPSVSYNAFRVRGPQRAHGASFTVVTQRDPHCCMSCTC